MTDLSFFTGPGGPFPDNGEACFGTQPPFTFPLHAANLREKQGRAESSFWFFAKTFVGDIEVLYQLHMFGTFEGEWPPLITTTSMNMTAWTLHLENEGADVKKDSCIGESEEGDGFGVEIMVTRMN